MQLMIYRFSRLSGVDKDIPERWCSLELREKFQEYGEPVNFEGYSNPVSQQYNFTF